MGRFTLRDEGKTICDGKVLKYKPYTKGAVGAQQIKAAENKQAKEFVTVNNASVKEDLVYDGETGELRPKKKEME